MFIAIIIPISSSVGAVIGGYALVPIFLFLHKTIYRKAIYGIQEVSPAKIFKNTLQGFYPSFLAFNFSSMILFLTPKIRNQLLTSTVVEETPFVMHYIYENFILLIFTIAFSMLFFSPGWFLKDAGIVYLTEELESETNRPVEMRTMGGLFNDYLIGVSSFGAVYSYIQTLTIYFHSQISVGQLDLASLIGWFGFPFYVILAVIPTFILLDMTNDQRKQYVRREAEKIGITRIVKISFE
jgi:hypothetical protein